jgi:hypothetical protein
MDRAIELLAEEVNEFVTEVFMAIDLSKKYSTKLTHPT